MVITLTGGIFETGAYGVPSKSQNPNILGQGGPSKGQLVSKWFFVSLISSKKGAKTSRLKVS